MTSPLPDRKLRRRTGSAILAVILVIVVLAVICSSIMSYTVTSYRSSVRKRLFEKAKIAAGNESEYLFYDWVKEINDASILNSLHNSSVILLTTDSDYSNQVTNKNPAGAPLISDTNYASAYPGITAARGLTKLPISANGKIPNSKKTGAISYYDAKTVVTLSDPIIGNITYALGRRFNYQRESPFNQAIFYQGDLDLNPSDNMTISGDIESNGSVYMGVYLSSASITLNGNVYYVNNFEGASDPMTGTQYYAVSTTHTYSPPTFAAGGRSAQVSQQLAENFVNNSTTPDALVTAYPTVYPTVNDVYRSIIAPPPTNTATYSDPPAASTLVAENATVASNRMYNKASLYIVVNTDGTATITDSQGNSYNSSTVVPPATVRQQVTDIRESTSVAGIKVNMTDVDIGALNTLIATNPTLQSNYNGVVYIYDKNSQYDGTASTVSAGKNGIRLTNGATTPDYNDAGFTVVTNNGLYIKGDYNTTPTSDGSTNRAAVMSDAITLLSQDWQDPQSNGMLTTRVASHDMTVNAAILTGNTPNDVTNNISSGGAQNLVRYLEDWSNRTTTIKGSVDQLFTSKYFNSSYLSSGKQLSNGDFVYTPPSTRNLIFDTQLAANPPSGSPVVESSADGPFFFRGDVYNW